MDKTVIEKNNTKIFNGLTAVLLVQELLISLIGQRVVATRTIAPNRAIIQYVSIRIAFILICGKNSIDRVIPMNVNAQIIMVAIIFTNEYHSPFVLQNNKKAEFLCSAY